jgi:hypothetical protein
MILRLNLSTQYGVSAMLILPAHPDAPPVKCEHLNGISGLVPYCRLTVLTYVKSARIAYQAKIAGKNYPFYWYSVRHAKQRMHKPLKMSDLRLFKNRGMAFAITMAPLVSQPETIARQAQERKTGQRQCATNAS